MAKELFWDGANKWAGTSAKNTAYKGFIDLCHVLIDPGMDSA